MILNIRLLLNIILNSLRFARLKRLWLNLLFIKVLVYTSLSLWWINNCLAIIQKLFCLAVQTQEMLPLACSITPVCVIVWWTHHLTWCINTMTRTMLALVWIFELWWSSSLTTYFVWWLILLGTWSSLDLNRSLLIQTLFLLIRRYYTLSWI